MATQTAKTQSDVIISDGVVRTPWDPFAAVPSLRRWLWMVFAVAACVFQGPRFVDGLRPSIDEGVDFFQEWLSAKNYWAGTPIYGSHRVTIPQHLGLRVLDDSNGGGGGIRLAAGDVNAHPPTSVLMVLPLGVLNYPSATLTWNLLSLAAFGASLWLLAKHLDIRFSAWSIFPLVTVLLVCSPFRQQMSQGQLNLVLLLLLTGTWIGSKSGHYVWAGVWLGLATAIKVFPAFIFLHFALRRQWKVVGGGLAALVAITLITVAVLGPQSYVSFARDSLPQGNEFRSDWINASALGLCYKLFDPSDEHFRTVPLWRSPRMARVVGAAACLAILLIWARTIRSARSRDDPDLAYGLSITTMLLVSPLTWDHYFLILTIPLAIMWTRLPRHSLVRLSFLVTVILLCLPPVVLWDALIPGGHNDGVATPVYTLTVNSYGFYGLMALFAFGVRLIGRKPES